MTIKERVQQIITSPNVDMEKDSIEKLVYIAYYIGRESAAKEVSNLYANHLAKQTERAQVCRYHKMVAEILQNGDGYIYSSDYAGDMTATFGSDETEV